MRGDPGEDFKARLIAQLTALRAELARVNTQTAAGEYHADLVGGVGDRADEAVSDELAAVENDQIGRLVRDIRETEAALERIVAGRFGRCEQCAEPIEPDRLCVRPSARRCMRCQLANERGKPTPTPSL